MIKKPVRESAEKKQPAAKTAAPKKASRKSAEAPSRKPASVSTASVSAVQSAIDATAPLPSWVSVTIRAASGQEFQINSSKALQQAAMKWSYVLRNRRRWIDLETTRAEQEKRALSQLNELGLDKDQIRDLGQAGIIEVSIPYYSEETGWEARVTPWEYLLTAATRSFRRGKQLLIIRHLDRVGQSAKKPAGKPERVLMIESAPGGLREGFTFDAERNLITSNLKFSPPEIGEDESRQKLRQRIKKYRPDVIHIAGFDTRQGISLGVLQADKELQDGYLLKSDSNGVDPIYALELARIINAADHKPWLVGCNIYNSAARICPLIVAEGADAALGFQDEFDDYLAEIFFTSFYRAWSERGVNAMEAFQMAFKMLREHPHIKGTGVTLWSARSLIGEMHQQTRRKMSARAIKNVEESLQPKNLTLVLPAEVENTRDWLEEPKVAAYKTLNYSMLHNNRDLFESLNLRWARAGRFNNIQVEVTLYVGAEEFKYRSSVELSQSSLPISDRIRIPLIYSTWADIRDSVYTTLLVDIKWGVHTLYCDTHQVKLLPLEEWVDTDEDRIWLPSFVQPRDPAISRVIDSAQRYLIALADYAGAGFDGYQSVDPKAEDKSEGVDFQAQAIWWSLIYDYGLSYINPPPVYTKMSQRLRTPLEVINGRRGTCIDLAILLASCLEYVEIYPVIFLLNDHAFPGYWRSDSDYETFLKTSSPLKDADAQGDQEIVASSGKQEPWSLGKDSYGEVLRYVREGKLVPIETTWLTSRGSFWDAVDEGIKNLRSKSNFHSMLDVKRARLESVTPIPMIGGQNGR